MELRLLWDIFRDRVWILILCVVAAIVLAVGIIAVSPTIYQGEATIQVKRISESASTLSLIPLAATEFNYIDKDNVVGTVDLFMNQEAVIRRVMTKCGITTNEFDRSPAKFADPGMISVLFRKMGVQIEAAKDSELFTVTGMSTNLDMAQRIANTFSEEFFAYYRDLKVAELQRVRATYEARTKALDQQVSELDAKELEFSKTTGLVNFESQRSNLLTQKKQAEDDLASNKNLLTRMLTERAPSHPEVILLNTSISFYEQRIQELKTALDTLQDLELQRVEMTRHRDNLGQECDSFDSAVRTIDAILALDMSHFMVVGPAEVAEGTDASDYEFAPNKGLILVVMMILGVMGGVILVFVIEYGNESPRLYASFEQLAGDTRTISVRGGRGWTLVLAELGRLKPGARIAILQRGGWFTHRFPAKLRKKAARSQTLQWIQVSQRGPSRGADSAIVPGEALTASLTTAGTGNRTLYSFTGLNDSPDGYLHAASFDFVIYVARSGLANIEDIRADLRYLRSHGLADRMIGVFYDC